MNTQNCVLRRDELWGRLRDAGMAAGEMPEAGDARAPWFVRVMLGIAGWIGAMFILGFVGAGFAFVMKSSGAAFVVGAGACFAAVAIFRAAPKSDFVGQFGLAVSLAGQCLLVFGAAQWFGRSATGIALYVTLQQVLLFILVPNFVHRFWTSWTAALAGAYAMLDAGLFAFMPAATAAAFLCVALFEFELARFGTMVRAGVYGLALAAVQTAVLHGQLLTGWLLVGHDPGLLGGEAGMWAGRIASAAVLFVAAVVLLRREGLSLTSGQGRIGLAGALILAAVSLKAPGVGPAAAILIVGYANADRVLAGLGIFALLGYLSHYYYALQATLLEKSALLAAAGLALLAVRLAMRHWWPQTEEPEHA
ncbi:MAG: DUF4401 domain-containing protein [Burkholderiales bacterium]|nr:DUF4401 domain-containing protein [Burkholderiales bacterium]